MAASPSSLQFERGFKTWSENTSVSLRDRLNTKSVDPLNTFALAEYLGVRVINIRKLKLDDSIIEYLCSPEGDEWSAVTIRVGDRDAIALNPSHSRERRASDMAHELSHIVLQHKPAQLYIDPKIQVCMRNFDQKQEDEANWLSGCLLLPRTVLLHISHHNIADNDVIKSYGVSQQMLRYRRGVSGINKQVSRPLSSR